MSAMGERIVGKNEKSKKTLPQISERAGKEILLLPRTGRTIYEVDTRKMRGK